LALTEERSAGERPLEGASAQPYVPAVDMEFERTLLKQCVHCGLCLDYCPTYRVLGVEMDSPRGRIYQIKAVYEGRIEKDDPHFAEHIYACLDCRACQTVCPAGVQYGALVEGARGVTPPESSGERTLGRFILRQVFTRNWALDLVGLKLRLYERTGLRALIQRSGLLKLLPGRMDEVERLLGAPQGGIGKDPVLELTRARGERRYRVGFITGCVMSQLQSETNQASVRVLARNGCEVYAPSQQGCCGALHVHSGDRETARQLARRNIEAFEQLDLDAVIINAAGCGSTLKEYGHLLARDPAWAERAERFAAKIKDISEFLAGIELNRELGEVRKRVTYQDPCHLVHGQGIRAEPRELLKAIPGLELVELADSDVCCGSAGIYNLTHYDLSMQILEPKLEHIAATGAEVLVAPNPGCAMQIAAGCRRRGIEIQLQHVVDLLDESYRVAERAGPGAAAATPTSGG
jgi:glycolate oxidase iron-sulfur subunit